MEKALKNFELILAASVFLLSLLIIYINKFLVSENKIDAYSCSVDSDCVVVKADGCGCTAGGSNTVINKKYQKTWENNLPSKMCSQVLSVGFPCTGSAPRCANNHCQFIRLQP